MPWLTTVALLPRYRHPFGGDRVQIGASGHREEHTGQQQPMFRCTEILHSIIPDHFS